MSHAAFAHTPRFAWVMTGTRLAQLQIVLFALAAGLLAGVVGYQFGVGDQIEELPIVLRAIDPTYLPGDFFLSASAAFNPRLFFAAFIAFLARWASVEIVFFVLTVLVHVALAGVSGLAAHDLFKSRAAAFIAMVFVLTIPAHAPGSAALLIKSHLTPAVNATPLVLLAIWALLRRKIVLSALLAATAAMLHPLLGLEGGGVILLAFVFHAVYDGTLFQRRILLRLFIAALPLAIVMGVWWFQVRGLERIPDEQFINILAYFRNPHHYVPSLFNPWGFVPFVIALIVGFAAWRWHRREMYDKRYQSNIIALLISSILSMCVAGYVFVELIPVRIVVMAQIFRMLSVVYWLLFLLLAGYAGRHLERRYQAQRIMKQRFVRLSWLTLLSVTGFVLIIVGNSLRDPVPQITLADLEGEIQDVAAFARLNTSEDAVFLTPPDWGAFRYLAERPILVDFKSFVFSDAAMVAWQQRLFDAYGEPQSLGFAAQDEMVEQYHHIDDTRLLMLHETYRIDYAVLFRSTPTALSSVYETPSYKIVRLESSAS